MYWMSFSIFVESVESGFMYCGSIIYDLYVFGGKERSVEMPGFQIQLALLNAGFRSATWGKHLA